MSSGRSRLVACALAALVPLAAVGCGSSEDAADEHAAHAQHAAEHVQVAARGARRAEPWRHPAWRPVSGQPLKQPQQLHSRDGVLRVSLSARRGRIEVSGSPVVAQPFNGQFVGPTLNVRPGDTIRATIHNGTRQQTNIHYHGFHVSPAGLSDNVFRTFEPGSRNRSVVRLPEDHEPGTFWYHVHFHGLSEGQVAGGLSGLIVVDGLKDVLPEELRGVEEKQLAIRNLQLVRPDTVATLGTQVNMSESPRLVNGQLRPTLELRSGDTQLWRLANIGPDLFYEVGLEGHRLTVVAEDGSPVWEVEQRDRLLIPPGKRFDVLVQGGKPGRYALKAYRYEGFAPLPTVDLAHLDVTGPEAAPALALPRTLPTTTRRLDDARIARRRRFVFSFGRDPRVFRALINGSQFDPHATDVAPLLGTVEEWTLVNRSDEDHPFHIHVNDFQVMSVNGKPYRARGLQDVVDIPANGGTVVIRNPFDDYTGHFVFHCHILGHEDAGMMKTIEVVRRGQRPTPPPMKGMARGHHGH